MPNPSGVNAHGKKTYPPDDILRESLLKYTRRGLTQAQKLARLVTDHQLSIGLRKLNDLERRLSIPSTRRPLRSPEELVQAVIDEAEADIQQNNGPNYIKSKLKNRDILVPRDLVRKIMADNFPEGAEKRYPGHKKTTKTHREPLSAWGPFHEVAGDGHEKLGALALNMGGLGLPMYGYRDKWSGTALMLKVVPDCRSSGVVGHLYIDLIQELGGIPLQLNLDKGSEIGHQVAIQEIARELCSPDIDISICHAVELLKSVHNIIIEMLWKWLREKAGLNIREVILQGKSSALINPDLPIHRDLFYWVFVPVVQKSLDEFREYWNQHTVRPQDAKYMPSGHVPIDALEHPESFGGTCCLIPVPQHIIDEFRQHLVEEEGVGSRESCLAFYSDEFASSASAVHTALGSPLITLSNAWEIFVRMSDMLHM